MREHKILTYCDVHLARHELHVEASSAVYFASDDVEATKIPSVRRVDMCAECLGEIAGLAELVDEHGVAVDEAPRPARPGRVNPSPAQHGDPGVCPLCRNHYSWLATHIGARHKLGAETVRDEAGKFPCPTCGEVWQTAMALQVHVVKAHESRLPYLLAEIEAAKARHPSTRRRKPRVAS